MKIKVLGCSGAVLPGHNATSFLINDDTLLDAGTVTSVLDIEEQAKIKNILITHLHLDHVKDLFFLADNLIGRVNEPISVLSVKKVLDGLREHFFNKTIWPDFAALPNYDSPLLKFVPISENEPFPIGGLKATPVKVNHSVEAVGYIVEDGDVGIVYTGDTGHTDDIWRLSNKIDRLKGVFIETSFPSGMENLTSITGHLTPKGLALELKKLDRKDIPVYISHIKPQYLDEIVSEVKALNNPMIHILSDGEELIF